MLHIHTRMWGNLAGCYSTELLLFIYGISIVLSLCLLVFSLIITSALFNLLEDLISRNKQLAIEKCLSRLYIHIFISFLPHFINVFILIDKIQLTKPNYNTHYHIQNSNIDVS